MDEPAFALSHVISLRDRRTLITGTADRIGRAIARRFAKAGTSLVLVDIHRDRLSAAWMELAAEADVEARAVDVSQREQRYSLWQAIAGCRSDILVNNASIYPLSHFLDMEQSL